MTFTTPGRKEWELEQAHQQERAKAQLQLLSRALSVQDADYRCIVDAYELLGLVVEKIKRAGEEIEALSPKRGRITAPPKIEVMPVPIKVLTEDAPMKIRRLP